MTNFSHNQKFIMKKPAFSAVVAALLLYTPAFSKDKDANGSGKEKTETTGQVIIEINGVPQIIELNSSPAVIEKQLKNISEVMSTKKGKADSTSKKQTSKQQASGGSISYHTIIVGPDGVVQEEKIEKNLEGDIFKNKQMLKGLPEQVRQQVEAAINKAGQNRGLQIKVDAGKTPGIMSPKMDLSSLLKDAASDLPADMRKQLMDAMKGIDVSGMNVGNIQARAIVIGPDGKKQEYSFGSEQKNTPSTKEPLATKKGKTKKTPSADAKVMDALNRILDRLDKIEGELKMLKNPNQ